MDIVQELLAILTTRAEALERLSFSEGFNVKEILSNNQMMIDDLMNELSNFGDAVKSTAVRDNAYQQLWTANLDNIETIEEDDADILFSKLEQLLQKYYTEILIGQNEIAEPFLSILKKQQSDL